MEDVLEMKFVIVFRDMVDSYVTKNWEPVYQIPVFKVSWQRDASFI